MQNESNSANHDAGHQYEGSAPAGTSHFKAVGERPSKGAESAADTDLQCQRNSNKAVVLEASNMLKKGGSKAPSRQDIVKEDGEVKVSRPGHSSKYIRASSLLHENRSRLNIMIDSSPHEQWIFSYCCFIVRMSSSKIHEWRF